MAFTCLWTGHLTGLQVKTHCAMDAPANVTVEILGILFFILPETAMEMQVVLVSFFFFQ